MEDHCGCVRLVQVPWGRALVEWLLSSGTVTLGSGPFLLRAPKPGRAVTRLLRIRPVVRAPGGTFRRFDSCQAH